MALMALGSGVSLIKERIFENRFMHVLELQRMGADIDLDGRTAIVRGVKKLSGSPRYGDGPAGFGLACPWRPGGRRGE